MGNSMNNSKLLSSLVLALGTVWAVAASAAPITVSGDADIFLAGQSSVPSFAGGAGSLPPSFGVSAGQTLGITATGLINCCSASPSQTPDGFGGSNASNISGYGNVGAYTGPDNALVGVFNVGTTWTPFVIGSSLSGLLVPSTATLLYLGIPDAFGFNGTPGYYGDNTGSFSVNIAVARSTPVPEPVTISIFGAGLVGIGAVRRRRRAGKR